MEDIKGKIGIFLVTLVAAILVVVAGYSLFFRKVDYWVQIDNSRVTQLSPMEYEYELQAYNENGSSKELNFKAGKELRSDAYLRLEVIATRGVYYWEEVEYNELPDKVKSQLAPKN